MAITQLLVGTDDVATILGVAKQTVYKWVYEGKFDKRTYLGHGRWNYQRIVKHIEEGTLFDNRKAKKRRILQGLAK